MRENFLVMPLDVQKAQIAEHFYVTQQLVLRVKHLHTNFPRYLRGYILEEFKDQNFNNRTLLYTINIIFSRIQ